MYVCVVQHRVTTGEDIKDFFPFLILWLAFIDLLVQVIVGNDGYQYYSKELVLSLVGVPIHKMRAWMECANASATTVMWALLFDLTALTLTIISSSVIYYLQHENWNIAKALNSVLISLIA